jgi:CubicO group peptidase (beta-lactamase class C family)
MAEEVKKKKTGRTILKVLAVVLAVLVIAGAFNYKRIARLYHAVTLFDADKVVENFRSIGDKFASRTIHHGNDIFKFKYDLKKLPETYTYKGKVKDTKAFIDHTWTTGLVVVKDDTILFEDYYLGNTQESKTIAWSVTKSFNSALFGIAISEGKIKSIEQTVTDYLPELKASGYNGVRIKDVLQMSSGVKFDENYGDFNSDINRMGRYFALNIPLSKFVASLKSDTKPGTFNHYVSMDTQVLGMIIVAATGRNLSEYMEEKLWKPLGMEYDAIWIIDSDGMEAAFGGLCAALRDYARFGRLYLHQGNWNGAQIVPAQWVKDSVTPDAPHLMPGKRKNSDSIMGYGYQWWIPENSDGDFMAIGIYGQAIYVSPRDNIVIARSAAYADYDNDGEQMEIESAEFFRAIAKNIGR